MPIFLPNPHYANTISMNGPDYDYLILTAESYLSTNVDGREGINVTGAFDYRWLQIDGDILTTRANGIEIGLANASATDSIGNTLTIGQTGSINAGLSAVVVQSAEFHLVNFGSLQGVSNAVLDILGDDARVENHGQIVGLNASGIEIDGLGFQLRNFGTVTGATVGVDVAAGSSGVAMNKGSVFGESVGVRSAANDFRFFNSGGIDSNNTGVLLEGTNARITNTGQIQGVTTGLTVAGSASVVNRGDILSDGDAVLLDVQHEFSSGLALYNSGSITGLDSAIKLNQGVAVTPPSVRIFNTGEIVGDMTFSPSHSSSNDQLFNSGTIVGDVHFGHGNDLFRGEDGTVSGSVFGGAGTDAFYGGRSADYLDGGSDEDSLWGNDGNDRIVGGGGNDRISGGDGDDTMAGGEGDDKIFGGSGHDWLGGNEGADILRGGQGNDELDGGDARDILIGGTGDDTLSGGVHHDKLFGGHGEDTLIGDGGRDRLDGGADDDVLTGGWGEDLFVFKNTYGNDEITDFDDDVDTLVLGQSLWGGGLTSHEALHSFASNMGGNVVFDFGDGDTLTLVGVASFLVLADDIVLI